MIMQIKKRIPKCMKQICRWIHYRLDMFLFPRKTVWSCPCCGLKFRNFVAGNFISNPEIYDIRRYKHTQQNVICPYCGALPRHRILAAWCEEHKEELKSSKILYFAPEDSMIKWMKRHSVTCTTADLSQQADLKLDIQSTGLPNECYDLIICNHVIEHVDDYQMALLEINRILQEGGSLICSFPIDPTVELIDEDSRVVTKKDRIMRFGQMDHHRVFGIHADVLLNKAGFDVLKIDGKDYKKEILPVIGPADYDMNCLFRCTKQHQ